MDIFLDCLPCVLKQVLEASRMATDKPALQEKIIEESLKILQNYKKYESSPDIVKNMHQAVKSLSGVSDPYKAVKERDIKAAKAAYPFLQKFVNNKQNKLYWALKTAATGNIIDSALYNTMNFEASLEDELAKEFSVCSIDIFTEKLKSAKNILIIGDNAGETVFDRILIEHLAGHGITYAVRSEPIINDATLQDALDSGLGSCAKIISTGCGAPGAILDQCSIEFLSVFDKSDIVISKGQGNLEALSDCSRPLFFLLKAKCQMIADKLGVTLNDYVFKFQKTGMI
ncbi:MAG: DUF89 family protein [Synergistaceae bacterium]|nr:DUF89 family protein [Synergistaceae bacterium]